MSVPARMPGFSRNCLRTSSIIWCAALDTDSMVMAENRKVSIPPMKRPMITLASRMSMVVSLTASA